MPLSPKSLPISIYQLRVTLDGTYPQVWRQIQVHGSTTFHNLHQVIQVIMGWSAEYSYMFEFKNALMLTKPDPLWGLRRFREPGVKTRRSSAKLSEVIGRKRRFTYNYNGSIRGWDWEHSISVERILHKESETQTPVCVSGARAGPPEQSGSSWGYHQLLEIRAAANPEEAEAKARRYISRYPAPWLLANETERNVSLMRWLETFDPDRFDLVETNGALTAFSRWGFRYFKYLQTD